MDWVLVLHWHTQITDARKNNAILLIVALAISCVAGVFGVCRHHLAHPITAKAV